MAFSLSEFSSKYHLNGQVILCESGGKRPVNKDWVNDRPALSDAQLDAPDHNKGLVLLDTFAVLDIDDYEKADKFFSLHGVDLQAIRNDASAVVYHNDGPSSSAKGKFKVLYARRAEQILEHVNRSAEFGFEFRTGKCQDILPGSRHPDGGTYVVDNAPDALSCIHPALTHIWKGMLVQMWRKPLPPKGASDKQYARLTDAEMAEHLAHLPDEWREEYDTWWKVGAALKRAEYPYELWAGWSKASAKWNPRVALGKWNTDFGGDNSRSPFTVASIIKGARDNGFSTNSIGDLLPASPDLSKLGTPFYTEEEIRAGIAPSDDVAPPERPIASLMDERTLNGYHFFRNEFVYVCEACTFYHHTRGIRYTTTTLPPAFRHRLMRVTNEKGEPENFPLNKLLAAPGSYMPVVDNFGFVPGGALIANDTVNDVTRMVVNMCDYKTPRPTNTEPSMETKRILDGMFAHFCNGDRECEQVLSHMLRALDYKMYNPAKRFDYGHVLISPETGTGKSFFALVLTSLIFGKFSRKVTIGDMESSFDAYKANSLVTCLEEAKVGEAGDRMFQRESHRLMNKLKDWMTAPTTTVNEKFEKPYITNNYNMILVTSNHVDCIPPQTAGDRRWLACVSRAPTLSRANPQLSRDATALMERAFTCRLTRDDIICWVSSFRGAAVNPHILPFNSAAVANMAQMAQSPVDAAVSDLYGPDRDPTLPDVLTAKQVMQEIGTELNKDPSMLPTKAIKAAMATAGAVFRSVVSKHRVVGTRVVPGTTTARTNIYILRNHEQYSGMSDPALAMLALEATLPNIRAVP